MSGTVYCISAPLIAMPSATYQVAVENEDRAAAERRFWERQVGPECFQRWKEDTHTLCGKPRHGHEPPSEGWVGELKLEVQDSWCGECETALNEDKPLPKRQEKP